MELVEKSIPKNTNIKQILLEVFSALVMAFFTSAISGILKYDLIRNYYNLRLVNPEELKFFFLIFIPNFLVYFILLNQLLKKNIEIVMSFIWLVFILLFAYFSPVKSLAIGSIIFGIPALFSSISLNLFKPEVDKSKKAKIIDLVFGIINVLIFIALIVIYILKSKTDYIPPDAFNGSMIDNGLIYYDHMKERWSLALWLFGILTFLYLVFKVANDYYLKKPLEKAVWQNVLVIVGILILSQIVFLSLAMVYRVKVFGASTYDFGIFVQMFHNMKNFEGMVTTLERSVAISHNLVHFSPIYYLMLPVYMILPFPETLQVLQILIVGSGLIPLWLLMKHFKTNKFFSVVASLIYSFSPALITSSFYDLHENCFLAPLLLFVLYFALKRKALPLLIATGLTLLIKEDAGLYLFFIGLFIVFSEIFNNKENKINIKGIILGTLISVSAISYFLIVTNFLNETGDGAMFWRYSNINIANDAGLTGIITGFLLNPTFFLATFFTPLKINTMLLIIASLGILPLMIKNKAAFFLTVPLIIMNYLSNYPYQHQFGFQYFYGSVTLLIFLLLLAEKDNRDRTFIKTNISVSHLINIFALLGLSVSLIHGGAYLKERDWVFKNYQENQVMYEDMLETLLDIPEDKVVVATGYLTPYLSQRYYVYDYDYYNIYHPNEPIDYIVIDRRINATHLTEIINECVDAGFLVSPLSTEYILIFEAE